MKPAIDPRRGDIEDDRSSPKRRSLLAVTGALLAEISPTKFVLAWISLVGLPALLLGLVPLVASAWLSAASTAVAAATAEISSISILVLLAAAVTLGGRPLLRLTERSFWTLNSLTVQPAYAFCREALRHLARRGPSVGATWTRTVLGMTSAAIAAVALGAVAVGIILLAWPTSRWIGKISDLTAPHYLIAPALANGAVLIASYFAIGALIWGIVDASMGRPRDMLEFDAPVQGGRIWRVAHLSDLHFVGERFGWRLESGRSGPQGNDRIGRVFDQLDALHAEEPLDIVLISGDLTDAGRSAEWAEFLDMLTLHPRIAERTLVIPGNHDVNIVDRANPARLDLPTSPSKRLRQLRALSAIAAVQGERVRVIDHGGRRLGGTLAEVLAPRLEAVVSFAETGAFRLSATLGNLWDDVFPMVFAPASENGLGIILLNSNAETHFSFTNALGMVSAAQSRGIEIAAAHYPRASWLVVLHHHLVEYPNRAVAFYERIGTVLINGSWFGRRLRRFADRVIVMHGHRHVDWLGRWGGLTIVSAPSPVMGATNEHSTCFYVHSIEIVRDGRLKLLAPQRIEVAGERGWDQQLENARNGSLAV